MPLPIIKIVGANSVRNTARAVSTYTPSPNRSLQAEIQKANINETTYKQRTRPNRPIANLKHAASILTQLIKRYTPIKTGRLFRSIKAFREGSSSLHPRTNVPYAQFLSLIHI